MSNSDGYYVFQPTSQTSSADGAGYVALEYIGHTYGRTPDDYLTNLHRDTVKELIFFKVSDAIRMRPHYRTIPSKTELIQLDRVEEPITDLRWMV